MSIYYYLYIGLCIVMLCIVLYLAYFYFHNIWIHRKLPPYVNSFGWQLKLLKTYHISPKSKILDLGCGDGKALRYICQHRDISQAVGYDINSFAIYYGKLLNYIYPIFTGSADIYTNITLINQDIYTVDLSGYDYIYLYLFPDFMAEIEDYIWSHTDPDTIIIANTFAFAKNEPIDQISYDQKIIRRFYNTN